jgi:hypothetical protein
VQKAIPDAVAAVESAVAKLRDEACDTVREV